MGMNKTTSNLAALLTDLKDGHLTELLIEGNGNHTGVNIRITHMVGHFGISTITTTPQGNVIETAYPEKLTLNGVDIMDLVCSFYGHKAFKAADLGEGVPVA